MVKAKKILLYSFLVMFSLVFTLSFLSSDSSSDSSGESPQIEKMFFDASVEKTNSKDAGKYIIVYNDKVKDEDTKFLETKNAKIRHKYTLINAVAIDSDSEKIKEIIKHKNVKGVYQDEIVEALLDQSVLVIGANLVQAAGTTGNGTKICSPDTGIDKTHPALKLPILEYDFVNNDTDAMDDNGHGTHVAGILISNDLVYRGVAPGADLMAVKVLNASGAGWTSDVISGINWCVDNGADIISLSLGGGYYPSGPPCDSDLMAVAANNAVDLGVFVLAATGNDRPSHPFEISAPACASKVIAVGSVTTSDTRTDYSNDGAGLDIVAPGSQIFSTKLGGEFVNNTGTSMATPHVAGTAALILDKNPTLYPDEVWAILRNTTKDLGAAGFDTFYGWGRVDAYAAYLATPLCSGDRDNDSVADCSDLCPIDSGKTSPGVCGCGISDDDADNDSYYSCIDDCNDNNNLINPGTFWYQDADNDSYGNALSFLQQCVQPLNYVLDNTDCNDSNSLEHPAQTWYQDEDNDNYSNGNTSIQCAKPVGYKTASELTSTSGDCNDNDSTINPGATEICDGKDNDCDGNTDEGVTDFYISKLLAPGSANAGQSISVFDITNKSGVCSAIASTTKIYFSTNDKFWADDIYLGSRAVPAFGSGRGGSSGSTDITIPEDICTQTYYLIAVSDADNSMFEWNEWNNKRSVALQITNPLSADFYVSSVSAPASANSGSNITVNDTTNKSGKCSVIASTTRVYLSKYSSGYGGIEIGSRTVPAFTSYAQASSGSITGVVPLGGCTGSCYIIVKSDADGAIVEWNEGNNKRVTPITII